MIKYNPGFGVVSVLLCGMGMTSAVFGAEYRAGDDLLLRDSFTDILFAAGGQVRTELTSTDDVFLAAGSLTGSVQTKGALFVGAGQIQNNDSKSRLGAFAGGSVDLLKARFTDLILVGGRLQIDHSEIGDDFIALGGSIHVGPNVRVASSSTVGGGRVRLEGQFAREVWVGGGEVTLSGRFSGNVRAEAEKLIIPEGAVIQGNLSYSADELELHPGARILGEKIEIPLAESVYRKRRHAKLWGWIGGGIIILGVLLVPGFLAWVFRGAMDQSSIAIRTRFWETLGKGALAVIAIPVAWIGLMVTLIGIPLGLVLIPFLLILPLLAWTGSAFTVGAMIQERFRFRSGRSVFHFASALIGACVLMVTSWIPYLGILVFLTAFLLGMGAMTEAAVRYGSAASGRGARRS